MKIIQRCNCGSSIEYAPGQREGSIDQWRMSHIGSCDMGVDTTHDQIASIANAMHGIHQEVAEIRRVLSEIRSVLEA